MPRVPTSDGPQLRVNQLNPVRQQNVDVSSGLQALGRGLGNVAEVVDKIADRDAQDEAFKAEAKLRESWANQRAALRNQYKKDQAEQYKTASNEWWEKARNEFTQTLSPRAQQLAGRRMGEFKLAQDIDTIEYVDREKGAAREINYRTLQDTIIRDAGAKITRENAGAVSATTAGMIRKNAIDYAASEGLNSDVGESMARSQLDKFHSTVALMLAGRPGGDVDAKAYLTEFGSDIPLEVRERVNDQIELAAAKAKTEAVKNLYGNLRLNVEQGRYPSKVEIEQLRQLDPLKAAELVNAAKAERKATRVETGGGSVKTDQATYFKLRDEILAAHKGNGPQPEILAYRDRVSRSDLEELKKMQEKGGSDPKAARRMFTEEQTIAAYRPEGLDTDKWNALRLRLQNKLLSATDRKGSDLSDREMREALDEEFKVGIIQKNWWPDSEKPRWQMTPEELKRAEFDSKAPATVAPAAAKPATTSAAPRPASTVRVISGGDRTLIMQALSAEKIPPTETNIQARYEQYLRAKGMTK